MVVGDSISQGSSGDYTWRYRLYEHLVSDGLTPQMVGPSNWLFNNVTSVQGDCTYADPVFENAHDATWGRMLADEMTTIQGEVSQSQPDYLLVLLGINDLSFGRTDVAGTEANLRTFVANARAGNPKIKIVLGLLLPKASEPAGLTAQVAQYNGDLPGIAAQLSTSSSPVVVADDASAINTATDLWDGTHPNAEGEIKIAAGFADALASDFGLGSAYPTPLPTVPTGPLVAPQLTVTPGDGQAQLSWTLTPGATGYMVWQENVTAGETTFYELPYPLTASNDPWTAGLLLDGGNYQYKLQACKGVNCGAFSNTVSVTPTGPTPAAPTGLTATAGDGQATLSWTAAAHATGYYVWQENVTAGDTAFTKLPYPVSGTSWTAGALVNGDTYKYELQSVNGLITGGTTAAVTVTPTGPAPAAPTGLAATAGNGQAALSWTPAAHATGYYVLEENVTAGETTFTKLPYPVSGSSWIAAGLVNGGTYQFELQSVNGAITGGTTAPVTVTPTGPVPAAPAGLTAAAGDGQAVLSWTPAPDATGYYVLEENVTAGDTSFTQLPYQVTGSSWTAGDLVNGAVYKFELESVNGLITGGTTAPIQVTPTAAPPAAPTGLAAAPRSHAAVLSWTPAPGATGYYVLEKNVTAGDTKFTQLPYPVTGSSWTAGGLTDGATYQWELQSVDGLITGGTTGPVTVTPTGPAPAAPSNFVATPGDGKAILTWTMPAGATCVYIYQDSGSGFAQLPYPVCDDTFTGGSLVNGATYRYKIQAYDDLIPGGTSSIATVTPTGPAPAGPENLTATAGNGKAVLVWNEASHATSYYVWQNGVKLPYPVTGGTWTARSLVNGAQYTYKIQSVDGLQPGGYSNTVTVTPLGPPPIAPGDLRATDVSWQGSVALAWTPSSTATGYYVYLNGAQLPYPVTGGSWTAGSLIPGKTYSFQLQAVSGQQLGGWSNTVTVKMPLPPAPTGLTVTASAATPYGAKLSWKPVSGADGYYIYVETGSTETYPNHLKRLPYMITTNHFTAGYLIAPGTQWFAVTAVRYGAESPQSVPSGTQVYMENLDYWAALQTYFSGQPPSGMMVGPEYFQAGTTYVPTDGVDRGIVLANAFIAPGGPSWGGWVDDVIQDRGGPVAAEFASSRMHVAWNSESGQVGILMQPSCPLFEAAMCKPALTLSISGAIPPIPTDECSGLLDLACANKLHRNYNYIGVVQTGQLGGVEVGFSVADAYTSLPILDGGVQLAVPGGIDGQVFFIGNGTGNDIQLHADGFPSWDFVEIPHWTINGVPTDTLIASRGQGLIDYLCTTCYGQTTNSYSYRP
jgi:hypothetical protein